VTRGDNTRQAIAAIRLLLRGPLSAGELAEKLGCNVRTSYRILRVLPDAGLELTGTREGKIVVYQLSRAGVGRTLGLR
jgi:DNA-binding transcriptional ArsR family regulator